tara:strand:- start:2702 stop:3892 length:1191 start_codon:yes stop_codon:yes gene_type:complete
MQINFKNIKFLGGHKKIVKQGLEPFNKVCLEFLSDFSKELFKSKKTKKYSDLIALAFWCRKKNLEKIKNDHRDKYIRKGVGILLHIPPNNVPISSIYSFIFGLISGNSNIIRIPNYNLENIKLVLNLINKIFNKKKYLNIKKNNLLIFYEKNDEISQKLSSQVDGRIIWGGDKTIEVFKKYKTKNYSTDLFFIDKYSISILNSNKLKFLKGKNIEKLSEAFYNDTFLMDQNACSSPHLIFWTKKSSIKEIEKFWKNLDLIVKKKFLLNEFISSKRLYLLNNYLINNNNLKLDNKYKNFFLINIKNIKNNIFNYRGFSGIFFQTKLKSNLNIKNYLSRKIQTITYFGLKKNEIENFVKKNDLRGIDRIVPVGQSLNLDLIWDGNNIVHKLTRIIDIK